MTDLPWVPAVYVVVILGSFTAAGAALSRWARHDALDRALVGTVCGVCAAAGVTMLLGMATILSSLPYLLCTVAVGAVSIAVLLRGRPAERRVPGLWSLSGLVTLATAAALTVVALVPTIAARTSGDTETRHYHIGNLVHWFQNHSIWELPFQNLGFFTATHPSTAGITNIGLLMAARGAHLIYATVLVFGALVVGACAMITRELGGRADVGALASIAVVSAPLVFGTQAHSLSTDLATVAFLLAGVAFLLRARSERDWKWVALAGFSLGFAWGSKYTMLLIVPVVLIGAIATIRPRRPLIWLTPGLVLLAAPWFLRNLLATGNPIFPQGLSVGTTQLLPRGQSPLVELSTPILGHVVSGRWDLVGRWASLAAELWGPALVLAVGGLIVLVVRGPRRPEQLMVAALGVVALGIYSITPYTGGGPEALDFLMASNIRYSMAGVFACVALAAAVLPLRALFAFAGIALVYGAWRMIDGYGWRPDLGVNLPVAAGAVVAAAGACTAALLLGQRDQRFFLKALAPAAAALVVVAGLVLVRIESSRPTTELQQVLAQAGAREIALIGVGEMRSVLGRDLEHEVRGVGGRGRAGERPPDDPEELAQAAREADPDVLVVRDDMPGVPGGWTPPPDTWELKASTPDGDVYVKGPDAQARPAPTPPPATDPPQGPAP